MLSIIAAIDENRSIGNMGANKMLWHLPGDLKNFRSITIDQIVVMGHNTYKSIGKPLKNRTNVILSKDRTLVVPDCCIYHSIQEILELNRQAKDNDEIMIIGGSSIFNALLPHTTLIYLTLVRTKAGGNIFFPEIDHNQWTQTKKDNRPADEHNQFRYTFFTLTRKKD